MVNRCSPLSGTEILSQEIDGVSQNTASVDRPAGSVIPALSLVDAIEEKLVVCGYVFQFCAVCIHADSSGCKHGGQLRERVPTKGNPIFRILRILLTSEFAQS